MRPFRLAMLAVASLLALSACSSTSSAHQGGAVGSTKPATAAPTSTVLAFPPKRAGEVARVTYSLNKGVPNQKRTIEGVMTNRHYVVLAQCSASRPGATMTYEWFIEAIPRTPYGRFSGSRKVSCDAGKITVIRMPEDFTGDVTQSFTKLSGQVTRAYAVLIPESEKPYGL